MDIGLVLIKWMGRLPMGKLRLARGVRQPEFAWPAFDSAFAWNTFRFLCGRRGFVIAQTSYLKFLVSLSSWS